jgi:TonB family protein
MKPIHLLFLFITLLFGSSSGYCESESEYQYWSTLLEFNHLDFVDPLDMRVTNVNRIPDDKCLLFFIKGGSWHLASATFFLMFKGGLTCEVSLEPENMLTKWYWFSGFKDQIGRYSIGNFERSQFFQNPQSLYGLDFENAHHMMVYDMNSSDSPTLKTIFENRDRLLGKPSDKPYRMLIDVKETMASGYKEIVYLSLIRKIEEKFGQPNDVKAFANVNFGESKSDVKNKLGANSSLSLLLEGQGNFPFLHHLYYKLKVTNYNFILKLIFNDDRLGSVSILSDDEPSDTKRTNFEKDFVGFTLLRNYKFKSLNGSDVIDITPALDSDIITPWFYNPKRILTPTLFEDIDVVYPSFSTGISSKKFSIYKLPINTSSYHIERSKKWGGRWRFELDYLPVLFSTRQRVYGEYANSRIEGLLEQLEEIEDFSDLFYTGKDVQDDTKIVDLGDVKKLPRVVFQVEPNYPESLKAARIGGYVVIEWVIDVNGNVLKPRVVRSSHREFNQPAIESIVQAQFTPAIKDGKPVAVRVTQRMDFNP